MTSRIYYAKPSITELEIRYVTNAVAHGWGEHCADYVTRLEDDFGRYVGVKHAVATSSGTGALHLGMAALGIGAGDEVILADSNWIATAAPIAYLGATPVFVDILPDTWCLDPERVKAAITPRTKAIVAVHLYGNLCDMARLLEIGECYGIPVIEDAAQAIGSLHGSRQAGSMGRYGAFSFHGTKTITTGEGGIFVTNDDALYARVLTLSNHGRALGQPRQFWPEMLGYKYKMANVQAAIGCAQLERVDELVAAKRRIFSAYLDRLSELPLRMNPEPSGTRNGCWMPTIVVDEDVPFDRERLLAEFRSEGIDGRVFFWPLSSLPMYSPQPSNRWAYGIAPRACNLPSYHDMGDAEIARVVQVVRRVVAP